MSTPKAQVGLLTFSTPGGKMMGRALHVSMADLNHGTWPRYPDGSDSGEPAEWALELGPGFYATMAHELLPRGIRTGLIPMHALNVDDAAKALERACVALEAFLADHEEAKAHLESRVMKAAAYGKVAELPLGEPEPKPVCGHGKKVPGVQVVALVCNRPAGHTGRVHGYAGTFWDDEGKPVSSKDAMAVFRAELAEQEPHGGRHAEERRQALERGERA